MLRIGVGEADHLYINGQLAEPTPAQAARLTVWQARADEAIARVRELDPRWGPSPSFEQSIEGRISELEGHVREAQDRISVLARAGIGPGPFSVESVPARSASRSFRVDETVENNKNGDEYGCHTCGARTPGTLSGNWIRDHQDPSALNMTGRTTDLSTMRKL
jgi:hypothetical protein